MNSFMNHKMTMFFLLINQFTAGATPHIDGGATNQGKSVINQSEQGQLPNEHFGNLFLRRETLFTGGRYENSTIPYLLMLPRKIRPGKKYPLIVWLHGHGPVEYSHEKLGTLNWVQELMGVDWETTEYNFFVLAPCCFDKAPWFTEYGDHADRFSDGKGDEMLTLARHMIDHAIGQNEAIDPDRITATGVSTGGTACWELAMRNPGLFAAIAPIASSGGDLRRVDKLKGLSVWAFHNTFDHKTPIEGERRTVEACRQLGIDATLTEFPKSEHNAWSDAFRQCHLLDWLLAQEQGASPYLIAARYELVTLYWTKRAGIVIGAMVILLAVYKEIRRRKQFSDSVH
jgi:dienelactone hydrolase